MIKRLEILAKLSLAYVVALLLWRPGRRRRVAEALKRPRRVLLVRVDNRVGEALLTTPLFRAARALPGRPEVHVLVHPKAARVLERHPDVDRVLTLDPRERKWGPFSKTIRALRHQGYDVVVNCASWEAPSVGPAIAARLIGADATVLGPDLWPVKLLCDVEVPALPGIRAEARQRLHLLQPLGVDESDARLTFGPLPPDPVVDGFIAQHLRGQRFAVVNPGGRLGSRRVAPEVFASAAKAIAASGILPVVTWGPGEEALAQKTLSGVPLAVLAPPTRIDQLASLMARAALTVCNNTGPMHLSVSVGTPTFALFLHMELERWGHPYPPHRMLDLTGVNEPQSRVAAEVARFATSLDVTARIP